MLQAYGLYNHIRANKIRSLILLAGFALLLISLHFSFTLIIQAFSGGQFEEIWQRLESQPGN